MRVMNKSRYEEIGFQIARCPGKMRQPALLPETQNLILPTLFSSCIATFPLAKRPKPSASPSGQRNQRIWQVIVIYLPFFVVKQLRKIPMMRYDKQLDIRCQQCIHQRL